MKSCSQIAVAPPSAIHARIEKFGERVAEREADGLNGVQEERAAAHHEKTLIASQTMSATNRAEPGDFPGRERGSRSGRSVAVRIEARRSDRRLFEREREQGPVECVVV